MEAQGRGAQSQNDLSDQVGPHDFHHSAFGEESPYDNACRQDAADQVDNGLVAELVAHLQDAGGRFSRKIRQDHYAVQDEQRCGGGVVGQFFRGVGRQEHQDQEGKHCAAGFSQRGGFDHRGRTVVFLSWHWLRRNT